MADLNHVVLIGRLTRDAELKTTANGTAVSKFSIAVNRRRKNGDQWEDEANFFDIVVWGRQGESLHPYLVKGKMIGVDGELRQDRWQQDGQNRSKVEVVANYLQLLGGGGGGSSYGNSNGASHQERPQNGNAASYAGSSGEGPANQGSANQSSAGDDGFTDDIPF